MTNWHVVLDCAWALHSPFDACRSFLSFFLFSQRLCCLFPVSQMDRRIDISDTSQPIDVQFSYSVEWYEDELEWKNRMSKYADSRFLPSSFEIHWLSIINSFVLVLLLTAFLTIILLRVLKNDFSRYMELDDEAMDEEEVSTSVPFTQTGSDKATQQTPR